MPFAKIDATARVLPRVLAKSLNKHCKRKMLRVRKTYYSLHLAESFISEYCSIYVRQPRYLALTFLIPQQPERGNREKSHESSTQKETRMRGGAIMESSLAGLYREVASSFPRRRCRCSNSLFKIVESKKCCYHGAVGLCVNKFSCNFSAKKTLPRIFYYLTMTFFSCKMFEAYLIKFLRFSREECNVFADLFLEQTIYFMSVDFVNQHVFFCCSIYIEIAQNSREEYNGLADLLF